MSANSNAQRLVVIPGAEEFNSELRASTTAEPVVCSFCYGTGMEVVAGKGARRCRCRTRDVQAKLLEALGQTFRGVGNVSKAVVVFEMVLAKRNAQLGDDHPDVAMSLGNIGLASCNMGDYAAAADHYERALAIWRRELDATHPFVAQTLHNLGIVTSNLGNHAAARVELCGGQHVQGSFGIMLRQREWSRTPRPTSRTPR